MKKDYQQTMPFHYRTSSRSSSPCTWKHTLNFLRYNNKPISYIILLILSYTLGYFSAISSSKQTVTLTPTVKPTHITELTSVTTSTNNNNCQPATSEFGISDKRNDHNNFGPKCATPVQPESIRKVILDRVFNGLSPYENFPPAHLAHLLEPKRVKGWGSYGAVFENLIKEVRPKVIIEVGSFLGASATHMAELTSQLGLQTQILCVDDFRGWPEFTKVTYVPTVNGDVLLLQQFMQNVISLNFSNSILPMPYSTGSALQMLCEWGVSADLIEVDAGHDFHSAWSDINLAYKLLRKPGGVMFGHDYFTRHDNKGVQRAINLFARVHGFKVRTDGQHWVLVDY